VCHLHKKDPCEVQMAAGLQSMQVEAVFLYFDMKSPNVSTRNSQVEKHDSRNIEYSLSCGPDDRLLRELGPKDIECE